MSNPNQHCSCAAAAPFKCPSCARREKEAAAPSHHFAPLYKAIARTIQAIDNCSKSDNQEWQAKHGETLRRFERLLPHGSGFDRGCTVILEKSHADRIVINAPFHHMDSNGYYDGWGDYLVIVTPSLGFDFSIRVAGRDRNGFKDYAADTFRLALEQSVNQYTGEA